MSCWVSLPINYTCFAHPAEPEQEPTLRHELARACGAVGVAAAALLAVAAAGLPLSGPLVDAATAMVVRM